MNSISDGTGVVSHLTLSSKSPSFHRLLERLTPPSTPKVHENDNTVEKKLATLYASDAALDAITSIQTWWTKRKNLLTVQHKMCQLTDELTILYNTTHAFIDKSTDKDSKFEDYQSVLIDAEYMSAMGKFLRVIPKDPNIIDKNVAAMVRSCRVVSSSFIISKFPETVLVSSAINPENGMHIEDVDSSHEATQCYLTSKYLVRAFTKLIRFLKSHVIGSSIRGFRQVLLTYRYVCRHFVYSLNNWKNLDAERFVQSIEVCYIQCYSMLLSQKKKVELVASSSGRSISDAGTDDPMLIEMESQCTRIGKALQKVLGEDKYILRIEEIRAQLETSFNQYIKDIKYEYKSNSEMISKQDNINFTSSVVSEITSASNESLRNVAYTENELKLLARLAELAGVENERLAHEITYDPAYKLPDAPDPNSAVLSLDICTSYVSFASYFADKSFAERMKAGILFAIRDNLVWSCKKSSVSSPKDLRIGTIVPVYANSSKSSILSAHIVAVSNSVDVATNASAGVTTATADDNTTGDDNSCEFDTKCIVTIQYICDGTIGPIPFDRIRLSTEPITAEPLLQAYSDLRHRIMSLIPKTQQTDDNIARVLSVDMALMHQMINQSSMSCDDLAALLTPLLQVLQSLQAPVRADNMESWIDEFVSSMTAYSSFEEGIVLVPSFFEYATACLDELHRDMGNFYISTLAPVLQQHGHSFLYNKFVSHLKNGRITLIHTVNLLKAHVSGDQLSITSQDISEAINQHISTTHIIDALGSDSVTTYVVARCFIALLQRPYRLDSVEAMEEGIPETLHMDTSRLCKIRDEVDIIALQLSILMIIKQYLAHGVKASPLAAVAAAVDCTIKYGYSISENEENELQTRLNILLRESDISLASITSEAIRCMNAVIGRANALVNREMIVEWEGELSKAIKNVIATNNPVLNLFIKRIYKILLCALCDRQPYVNLLSKYSLHGKAQTSNITALVTSAKRLFTFHMKMYSRMYSNCLSSDSFKSSLSGSDK